MAKKAYIGVDDKAKAVSKMYVGVGDQARKVKTAYVGDSEGEARLCYEAEPQVFFFAGRKIYRHPTLQGSVIEYNEFGEDKKLLVADAVYRAQAKYKTTNYAVPGINDWQHSYFPIRPENTIDILSDFTDLSNAKSLVPYEDKLTDTYFQEALTETLKPVLQSAKEATDYMIADGNCPGATFARSKSDDVGIELQLPNIYQLLVMYASGDVIDSIDPTLSSSIYRGALGRYPGNSYRWCSGGAWSSTSYSFINGLFMFRYCAVRNGSKISSSYFILPVAEI